MQSVAVDSEGNVYVSDWSGFIRKFWTRERSVTIIAGTGIHGFRGDGGPATNAMIGKAPAIALDGTENLYLADTDNNRIRVVSLRTGVIRTLAASGSATDGGDGGPALKAGVARPTGIVIDDAGDLYFASSWSRVRKMTPATGLASSKVEAVAGQTVTSFGGDGGPATDALFWNPVPVAVDQSGNIYIADYENSRIRKLTMSNALVTVAGSGQCRAGGPMNVTICDSGFSGDGGPAGKAVLNYAASAAMDSKGNLYIADTLNHRVRRVDALTDIIATIAGTGHSGFSGDGGPATNAEITFPAGIAVDAAGLVYFSDQSNHSIRMLTPQNLSYSGPIQ